MKIKSVTIKNFRGYGVATTVDFNDLTAIVGKNDIGKSTILDALDIFFNDNKGIIKIDKHDINKDCLSKGDNETIISVIFSDLPDEITIDESFKTKLSDQYLLNASGDFEIIKKYKNATTTAKVFIVANHPSNTDCNTLLCKKIADLKSIVESNSIGCTNKSISAVLRRAIWDHYGSTLSLQSTEIDVSSKDGDIKAIWEKLQQYLPLYTLFQSDRKNTEGDSEVQDPLNEAVRQIINDPSLKAALESVADEVRNKLQEVSDRTLIKLKELNPDIANSLHPIIPQSKDIKWQDVFKKVSITGDEDIPINKRGSGVKRLILLSFFKAEAERLMASKDIRNHGIIYAIEEPETSQHTDHQIKLIAALKQMSINAQVIITTHSPKIVKELDYINLRLVSKLTGTLGISTVNPASLPYPSLNEVNFIAFGDVSEEYHNELYGHIEHQGMFNQYKLGKSTMIYRRDRGNGYIIGEDKILTEYIRHQIHHPENILNVRYTSEQLKESIDLMRSFITNNP